MLWILFLNYEVTIYKEEISFYLNRNKHNDSVIIFILFFCFKEKNRSLLKSYEIYEILSDQWNSLETINLKKVNKFWGHVTMCLLLWKEINEKSIDLYILLRINILYL